MQLRSRARAVRPHGTGGSPGCSSLARVCSPWGRCRSTPRPWDCAGVAVTFFVGSLFFTCAAFLQYREAVDALPAVGATRRHSLWVWAPRNLVWLAGAIQLAGTLWFNWSTANALRVNLSAALTEQRVWRPDALGSVAFLVVKRCGVAVCRSRRHCRPAQAPDVEDRRDQRGRLCCVRHLGCRGLCPTRRAAMSGTPSCPISAHSWEPCASSPARF